MNRRTSLPLLAILAIALTALLGCSSGVDQNPAFIKLTQRVSALEESRVNTETKLDDLGLDITTVLQDISSIQATMQRESGASPEVQNQINTLSQSISRLDTAIQDLRKEVASVKTAASAPRPSTAAPAAAATRTAPAPEPARPAGFYYTVKEGDTLESIARANGMTAAALAAANNLPASARIFPGQRIYVQAQK